MAETLYSLGTNKLKAGQKGEAVEAFKKAVEHDPAHHLAFNNMAVVFDQAGQLEQARRLLMRAYHIHPVDINYKKDADAIAAELKGKAGRSSN